MEFIQFGTTEDNSEEMPPKLEAYARQQYINAWELYIDAGCPFGVDDVAMLIWFEFDQQTRSS